MHDEKTAVLKWLSNRPAFAKCQQQQKQCWCNVKTGFFFASVTFPKHFLTGLHRIIFSYAILITLSLDFTRQKKAVFCFGALLYVLEILHGIFGSLQLKLIESVRKKRGERLKDERSFTFNSCSLFVCCHHQSCPEQICKFLCHSVDDIDPERKKV